MTLSLDNQWDAAKRLIEQVRQHQPGYGARQFLDNFPFQRRQDISRIEGAFRELSAGDRKKTGHGRSRRVRI